MHSKVGKFNASSHQRPVIDLSSYWKGAKSSMLACFHKRAFPNRSTWNEVASIYNIVYWLCTILLKLLDVFIFRWERWKQKCQDDSETTNWLTANTKPCPKCHKMVEKNGGCNLVYCRCGQVLFHSQRFYSKSKATLPAKIYRMRLTSYFSHFFTNKEF